MGNAPQRNTCWLFGGIGYFLPCGQYGLGTFFGSVKPMPIDDDCWVYYINTDLMLTAPVNLAPLAQAMAPGDLPEESISCLHDSQADGDLYHSVFEASGPQGSYPTLMKASGPCSMPLSNCRKHCSRYGKPVQKRPWILATTAELHHVPSATRSRSIPCCACSHWGSTCVLRCTRWGSEEHEIL